MHDGVLRVGDRASLFHKGNQVEIQELGLLIPEPKPQAQLQAGQVGYLITGIRLQNEIPVGETIQAVGATVEPFPGFKPLKPMVFSGIYPMDSDDLDRLRDAIEKLTINDSSISSHKESSASLGTGFRCGFLGLLHMDVFRQRLEEEYDLALVSTWPTVPYRVTNKDSTSLILSNSAEFPNQDNLKLAEEPVIEATITMPNAHLASVMKLCIERRGVQVGLEYLSDTMAETRWLQMKWQLPMAEVVTDFYDRLKDISSGYASFDYIEMGYMPSDLVRVDILLNGDPVPELCFITHRDQATSKGRRSCEKLRETLPRQMFKIAIQAAIGSKILARETINAFRKDVTAKIYGGDVTRKLKLLNKQKEGQFSFFLSFFSFFFFFGLTFVRR